MAYNPKEFKKYPDIMNKVQLQAACHISESTAQFLLQFNLIPYEHTGKQTRCYKIKKSDVIAYLKDRDVHPEKYVTPKYWYKFGTTNDHPFRVRPLPSDPRTVAKARAYYENQLKDYPDVLDVADIVAFTGYNRRTVAQWMRLGKLKALQLPNKYIVPKSYLIDWFVSEPYNQTHRKSIQHSKMIWAIKNWHGERK